MRWKQKVLRHDQRRIIKRFLFLPRTVRGETRWLEFAEIEQRVAKKSDKFLIPYLDWQDEYWVNR